MEMGNIPRSLLIPPRSPQPNNRGGSNLQVNAADPFQAVRSNYRSLPDQHSCLLYYYVKRGPSLPHARGFSRSCILLLKHINPFFIWIDPFRISVLHGYECSSHPQNIEQGLAAVRRQRSFAREFLTPLLTS